MSRKILFLTLFTLIIVIAFFPTQQQTNVEPLFDIELNYMIKSSVLDDFGVQIDLLNSNDTVILNEDPTFHFAFYFDVCLVEYMYGGTPYVYGEGNQPQYWWESREVNFTKYGDTEEHFLETRMYGTLNVFIDDVQLGLSNFDAQNFDDTNQSWTLSLEKGVHYLTVIAAEYQLPNEGDTIDDVQLLWAKDQHIFHVIENTGDPLPTVDSRNIYLTTIENPYAETFETINGIPLEGSRIRITDVDITDPALPVVSYDYNVSTDGNFEAITGTYGLVDFIRVGDGETRWWINDNTFAVGGQQLHSNHNYIYICSVSTKPEGMLATYNDIYFPLLEISAAVLDVFVEVDATETIYTTVTTTETIYNTETETYTPTTIEYETTTIPGEEEASSPLISVTILAFISICSLILLRKKRKGGCKR